MHLFINRIIAIFALPFASVLIVIPTHASDYKNAFWEEFGHRAVAAQLAIGQNMQSVTLKGLKDGLLMTEMSVDGTVAVMGMPTNDMLVRQLQIPMSDRQAVQTLLREKAFSEALEKLRPLVYPLIAYHKLPISFKVIHQLNFMLLEALIDDQSLQEANDLIRRISLSEAPVHYSRIALELVDRQILAGMYVQASELIASLPLKDAYASNIPKVVIAIHKMRDAQQFELAIPLYRSIEGKLNGIELESIQLWIGYCFANTGQKEASEKQLLNLKIEDKKDKNFPLYQLVNGSIAHQDKQYNEALDQLSKGFVYSQSSDEWVPEMLYIMGDCYFKTGNRVGAQNIWLEITQLYENTPWFSRAQNALNKNN